MVNRTICEVLREIRTQLKLKIINKNLIRSLVEEVQVYANRMEAALWDQRDIKDLNKEIKNLKQQKKEIKQEIEDLKGRKKRLSGGGMDE